jgi:hypothetical protein
MTGLGGYGAPWAHTTAGSSMTAASEGRSVSQHLRIRGDNIGIPPL